MINFPLLDLSLMLSSSFDATDEVTRSRPCRPRRIVESDGAGKKEHDDDDDDDKLEEEESHRTSVVAPAKGIIIISIIIQASRFFNAYLSLSARVSGVDSGTLTTPRRLVGPRPYLRRFNNNKKTER